MMHLYSKGLLTTNLGTKVLILVVMDDALVHAIGSTFTITGMS